MKSQLRLQRVAKKGERMGAVADGDPGGERRWE